MRVVFVSHLGSLKGGADRALAELAVALRERTEIVPVVLVPGPGDLAAALGREGILVRTVRLPRWTTPWLAAAGWRRPLLRAFLIGRVLLGLPAMVSALRAVRPDVVVTSTATLVTPAIACRVLRVPHVWWLQEYVTLDHQLEFLVGEKLAHRIIGTTGSAHVTNSEAVATHFERDFPRRARRCEVVPLGIDVAPGRPRRAPNEWRPLRLLHLGKLSATKGTPTVLEAVARVERARPGSLRLRAVGNSDPEFAAQFERMTDELELAEVLARGDFTSDVVAELDDADLFVMASTNEAFGRVTVEALKRGLPVVGTDAGGTREIVRDGETGVLVKPADPNALAEAIERFVDDRKAIEQMSVRALRDMKGRFSMSDEVAAMTRILTGVASADDP